TPPSTPSPDSSTPSPDSSTPSPSPDTSSTPSPSLSSPSPTPPKECQYSDFTPSHTALLPEKPECQIHKDDLSEEEKEQILQLHNELRAKVARGEELRGAPGPQPPAADMRELVWNDELALVAQAWASQCPYGHDDYPQRRICSRDYEVGQNIHYYWGYAPEPDWPRAVNSWYDEVADMPREVAADFKKQPSAEIGHYTQVVWASTHEVGCGIIYYLTEKKGKMFPASKTYVCNYGGSGNIRNRPLYTEGPAATACPNGTSLTYPDLCL
ncbi:venom allergen 5-like, partial [Penaeus chinensis]|uniref:venom allergen 5-like n=1 Tax=Penaeus chinensis TaxID=139456 RepID=UPI001FB6A662